MPTTWSRRISKRLSMCDHRMSYGPPARSVEKVESDEGVSDPGKYALTACCHPRNFANGVEVMCHLAFAGYVHDRGLIPGDRPVDGRYDAIDSTSPSVDFP